MTLDEFEALKMCAAEERRCPAPSWTLPPLQGISKDLAFDGLDEAIRSRPSTSFLNASDSRGLPRAVGFLCECRLRARARPADVDRLPAWFASWGRAGGRRVSRRMVRLALDFCHAGGPRPRHAGRRGFGAAGDGGLARVGPHAPRLSAAAALAGILRLSVRWRFYQYDILCLSNRLAIYFHRYAAPAGERGRAVLSRRPSRRTDRQLQFEPPCPASAIGFAVARDECDRAGR